MGLFLFRFWPVLIPLIVYWLWLYKIGRKATINGQPILRFRDGPWYWMVIASLAIGIGCFIIWGSSIEGSKGTYVPPHIENGVMVPGHVEAAP